MQLFGIGRNGSFAQYATIPNRTSWKNDQAIPLEAMSSQEPLGNAVHAVTKAGVEGKNGVGNGDGTDRTMRRGGRQSVQSGESNCN